MQSALKDDYIELQFGYDEELICRVKTIPGRIYNPETRAWLIPKSSLHELYQEFEWSQGDLYPNLMELRNEPAFYDLNVYLAPGRLIASGADARLRELARSLQALMSFYSEDPEDYEKKRKTLCRVSLKPGELKAAFPRGMTYRTKEFLEYYPLALQYSFPPRPEKILDLDFTGSPRSYQQETADKILSGEIPEGAALVLPTGAGKTFLAALIIHKLGLNTIFCTYSLDLALQAKKMLENLLNCKIGYIAEGQVEVQPVSVATVKTLLARKDELQSYLDTVELAFIDEGHMLGAETVFQASCAVNAYYTYALTATPKRLDGKEIFIEAGSGPVNVIRTDDELINEGHILPVEIKMYYYRHSRTFYDIRPAYKYLIARNEKRDELIIRAIKENNPKSVLVLVKYIDHGKSLAAELNAPFVHGKTPSKERQEILKDFQEGKFPVLIASEIFNQGVDIPECEALVLAHGGASETSLMQKIGRVRRPYPGKEVAVVIDIFDDDQGILRVLSKKRIKMYEKHGFTNPNIYTLKIQK